MFSSCDTYWTNVTKFIIVRTQWIVASRFSINNDVITKINCRIINFCLTSFHCWILMKCLNRLSSIWTKICRNRSFNWIDVANSITIFVFRFRLMIFLNKTIETTFFINVWHQLINFIIIFLNNWYNMSKFINVWTLQNLCFHVQLCTWCMRIFLFSSFEFFICLTNLICVYSNVRYFHVRKKSSRLFENIRHMLQCRFFFKLIIKICYS